MEGEGSGVRVNLGDEAGCGPISLIDAVFVGHNDLAAGEPVTGSKNLLDEPLSEVGLVHLRDATPEDAALGNIGLANSDGQVKSIVAPNHDN